MLNYELDDGNYAIGLYLDWGSISGNEEYYNIVPAVPRFSSNYSDALKVNVNNGTITVTSTYDKSHIIFDSSINRTGVLVNYLYIYVCYIAKID